MIKISELLTRKPGMSRVEFHDYWRSVHAPLVLGIPEIKHHNRRYVQCHTQSEWFPFLPPGGALYDGIAEIWCDSLDVAHQLFREPKFAELIAPDELQFLDVSKTITLVTEEPTVYERPGAPLTGGVKLFELAMRRKGASRAGCLRYWRLEHRPLVRRSDEMLRQIRRYNQCHSVDDDVSGVPPMRYDGVAELWFESMAELDAAFSNQQYRDVVHPDEPKLQYL
jgi:uncharacterized protein (TIGR02118 family)